MNQPDRHDDISHIFCGFNWFWISITLLCTLTVVSVVVFLGWRTDRLELNINRAVQRNDEQHAVMKRGLEDLIDYVRSRDEIKGDRQPSEKSR